MTGGYCPKGCWDGDFHGKSAIEAEELPWRGDFRPDGATTFHGETAILVAVAVWPLIVPT